MMTATPKTAHSFPDIASLRYASIQRALPSALSKLPSHIPLLDTYLGGGLSFSSLTEWGMPMGRGGRELLRAFLANLEEKHFVLWIMNAKTELNVYPPSWVAQGVDFSYLRFAVCERPIEELKAVFLNPIFKIIILDAPLFINRDELAFIANQARKWGQMILLLRSYFLHPEQGNVWAKLRLNCWQDPLDPHLFTVKKVRGSLAPAVRFKWEREKEVSSS